MDPLMPAVIEPRPARIEHRRLANDGERVNDRVHLGDITNTVRGPGPGRIATAGPPTGAFRQVTSYERVWRAALALRLVLSWLCTRPSSGASSGDLVATASTLVDCINRGRSPDPTEMERWDDGCRAFSHEHPDDPDLPMLQTIRAVLTDTGSDIRFAEAGVLGAWVVAGQMAAALWPGVRGPHSVREMSREAVTQLVACSDMNGLRRCLQRWIGRSAAIPEAVSFNDQLQNIRELAQEPQGPTNIGQFLMNVSSLPS